MTRWRLITEYEGTGYVGWQRQNNGPSIQESLETAVKKFSGETVQVFGAGRTDAGVHALAQVAHFDMDKEVCSDTIKAALNAHLRSEQITILCAVKAIAGFDSRFSAHERIYLYRILNRRAKPALLLNRVWHVGKPLNDEEMQCAAQYLIGNHDFSSFRATSCQAMSAIKTLNELNVERVGEEVQIRARAKSFLHHQVRNIVGTLVRVGVGRWPASDVKKVLQARTRSAAGPTAPPNGLYLVSVKYPEPFDPVLN